MKNGRRNFLKTVGLGAVAVVAIDAKEKPDKGFYNKALPYKNPKFLNNWNYDNIIGDFYSYDIDKRTITIHKPMTLINMYNSENTHRRENEEIRKYDRMTNAMTRESIKFNSEVWTLTKDSYQHIRNSGFYIWDKEEGIDKIFAAVAVLTEEGMVFDENKNPIPNGGILPVIDGSIQGYYQKSKEDKMIALQEHFKNHIGVENCNGTLYSIA